MFCSTILQVDELLDWTTGLNFEEYWTDWKTLATSEGTDMILREYCLVVFFFTAHVACLVCV